MVGQQLDSFDEFLKNTIQELVDDAGELSVTPENQYIPGQDMDQVTTLFEFQYYRSRYLLGLYSRFFKKIPTIK